MRLYEITRADCCLTISQRGCFPLARYVLQKPERVGHQLRYEAVFSKVRNIKGRWEDIGITVLPHK